MAREYEHEVLAVGQDDADKIHRLLRDSWQSTMHSAAVMSAILDLGIVCYRAGVERGRVARAESETPGEPVYIAEDE